MVPVAIDISKVRHQSGLNRSKLFDECREVIGILLDRGKQVIVDDF